MASGVSPTALREARERAGLTQHQLARLIGVAGGERISRWELGTSTPRPELLARLAQALDTPATNLLAVDDTDPGLQALRYAAGLSVADLAEQIHVAATTYRRWEDGHWQRIPSRRHLAALAQALHVSTETVQAAFEHGNP